MSWAEIFIPNWCRDVGTGLAGEGARRASPGVAGEDAVEGAVVLVGGGQGYHNGNLACRRRIYLCTSI